MLSMLLNIIYTINNQRKTTVIYNINYKSNSLSTKIINRISYETYANFTYIIIIKNLFNKWNKIWLFNLFIKTKQ